MVKIWTNDEKANDYRLTGNHHQKYQKRIRKEWMKNYENDKESLFLTKFTKE